MYYCFFFQFLFSIVLKTQFGIYLQYLPSTISLHNLAPATSTCPNLRKKFHNLFKPISPFHLTVVFFTITRTFLHRNACRGSQAWSKKFGQKPNLIKGSVKSYEHDNRVRPIIGAGLKIPSHRSTCVRWEISLRFSRTKRTLCTIPFSISLFDPFLSYAFFLIKKRVSAIKFEVIEHLRLGYPN